MPYAPLIIPDACTPALRSFLREVIDVYFDDFHHILLARRDEQGLKGSFQRLFVILVFAIADGAAQFLHPGQFSTSERFKYFLNEHYPWHADEPEGFSRGEAIDFLWETRCAFVHRLGTRAVELGQPHHKVGNIFSLSDSELEKIENLPGRPFSEPSVRRTPDKTVLWIETFYWGVRRAIEDAVSSAERCKKIEDHIRSGAFDHNKRSKRSPDAAQRNPRTSHPERL